MKYNKDNHHRHSIRLKEYDYSRTGAYFVTICTNKRECLFGDIIEDEMRLNEAGQMIGSTWNDLPVKYPGIEIDEFIVMPNHMHAIVVISASIGAIHELPLQAEPRQRRKMLLPRIIGFLKMNSAIAPFRKTTDENRAS